MKKPLVVNLTGAPGAGKSTGAATIFTKPYDLIMGTNVTDEMWDATKAYVAEEQVASLADQIQENGYKAFKSEAI